MHDAVRDMALSITSMSPRYTTQAGMQLKKLPKEEEWRADVEKVSLMNNSISEIPEDMSPPNCQLLTTLLLQGNPIPNAFFANMPHFGVLNLSFTSIESLPDSISGLKNLRTLLLNRCLKLRHVPCLSKLQGLKKLDLNWTHLKIDLRRTKASVEEVMTLENLECFEGHFQDVHELNEFVSAMQQSKKNLISYALQVGLVEGFESATTSILPPHWLLPNLQNLEQINVESCDQLGVPTSGDEEAGSDVLIKLNLPKLRELTLKSLPGLKSICSKRGVMVCDSLRRIHVDDCSKLKRIPPFVPLVGNGQPYAYAPPSLQIKSSPEGWWESLEWDHHPNFKNVLQPHFILEEIIG
ncbi:hypothetical protein V6N11_013298 [Hibiscus sabdariffa]|uniref:Disease resistance protein At4g27190-like leucine-rich repeats domain-containing protein n=1 Tax=Hibiscus sabdariffa TaxID=183260 RepID=A0ABR2NMY2_9ROSI